MDGETPEDGACPDCAARACDCDTTPDDGLLRCCGLVLKADRWSPHRRYRARVGSVSLDVSSHTPGLWEGFVGGDGWGVGTTSRHTTAASAAAEVERNTGNFLWVRGLVGFRAGPDEINAALRGLSNADAA